MDPTGMHELVISQEFVKKWSSDPWEKFDLLAKRLGMEHGHPKDGTTSVLLRGYDIFEFMHKLIDRIEELERKQVRIDF
jgi:hypothetical protein